MIDVYNLINSKTIGNYCRKIKHQFNTLEKAIIIYRCKNISIEKKIEYYNEIINNPTLYPDMYVRGHGLLHFEGERDAIELIKIELDRLNFLIKMFNKQDKNAIFTVQRLNTYKEDRKKWIDDVFIFKTLYDTKIYIEQYKDGEEDYYREHKIIKKYLNSDCAIISEYKKNPQNNFELYDICCTRYDGFEDLIKGWKYGKEILFWGFYDIYIYLPTPFKKGDLITDGENRAVIYEVLSKEEAERRCFDSSDMYYNCYVIDYYEKNDREIYLESLYDYDKFEYYTGELKGFERILKAISSLIKGKNSGIDLFLDAYNYIKAEDILEENREYLHTYIDEGLELAGLNKKVRKRITEISDDKT